MRMTRKHYVLIAKNIRDNIDAWLYRNMTLINEASQDNSKLLELTAFLDGINYTVSGLCVVFERDNPNFNRSKFIEACGLSDEIPQ